MARQRRGATHLDLNLTSLMDVTFLLIVFFVLVSNFAAQQLPQLDVPQPDKSQAIERNRETKSVIVSIVPDENDRRRAAAVHFGGNRIPYDKSTIGSRITELLAGEIGAQLELYGEVQVDLRADMALDYDQVDPVMQAIADVKDPRISGINRINLVAEIEEE